MGVERRYYARDCVIIYHDYDPEEDPRPVYVDPAIVKRADTSLERLVVSKEIPLKVFCAPRWTAWLSTASALVGSD